MSLMSSSGTLTQLDGLFQRREDGLGMMRRQGADADEEAAEVIDEGDEVTGPQRPRRAWK